MTAIAIMEQAASLEPVDSAGVQAQRLEQNGIAYLSGGVGEACTCLIGAG
jgi:hypothetical protein